uniref:Uncharacterized protein n=1 Tax=viral metagenome TaxID=1070528 RepID=A0A6C0C2A2_9ZZZZ
MSAAGSPLCKRPKTDVVSLDYATWAAKGQSQAERDYLKLLYPHERDDDCFLEEATHTYYVRASPYKCSVSSVWKVFFEEFDATRKAKEMIRKAEVSGIRSFESSIYNLYVYLLMERQITPNCSTFFPIVERTFQCALTYYQDKKWEWGFPGVHEGIASMEQLISHGCMKPEKCKSCYFFAMLAGCSSSDLCLAWNTNGALESFKGTLLHKRAELYMQQLGAWQLEQGRSHVTIGEMLSIPTVLTRTRSASSMDAAMCSVAKHTSADFWNHPATQAYLLSATTCQQSPEFMQLERWMALNPNLSPFRSEWSIFDENAQVAGQVDSLWFDEEAEQGIVMADWKRARELLSSSQALQREQSFGEKGVRSCPFAPSCPNPCAGMYNCSYNHYMVQQHLYADFILRKYDLKVEKMWLVQCHPNLGQTEEDFNVADLPLQPDLAATVLNAFHSGWKKRLAQFPA